MALPVIILSLIGASCSVTKDASSWDDVKAKEHFLNACQRTTEVGGGTTTIVELASKNYCQCVLTDITKKHKLLWDDMLEYESKVADAKAGNLPIPPEQLTKAAESCRTAGAEGPAAPGSN